MIPNHTFNKAKSAVIQREHKAYSIKWICQKEHINFDVIIGKQGTQHAICLLCGEHYEYNIEKL